MSRLRALVVTAFLAAGSCNAAEPVAPVTTDGNRLAAEAAVAPTAAEEGSLEEQFERYVCEGAPGCDAHDISDRTLDYGEWLATSLGVAPLSRLRVAHAFYVEAGPGTDGASLSLGQRQLVCFARAMLADPRIIILDEATSSVDTLTELRIQRALARLLSGRTSFVVAHRLSTIRSADHILVLDGGRITEFSRRGEAAFEKALNRLRPD